jgi:hypothetical protein
MALKVCIEPSTGHVIHATQVLDVSEEDAMALLASESVAAAPEAAPTTDVGFLAMQTAAKGGA